MEQTNGFTDLLFQAITERQQLFDSFLLPKLQEEYRIAQSSAKTIRTVLVKKGILRDDPYKYDSKISEIEIPSEEAFADSEKTTVIGIRLAHYEAMLDFINNYYQFTCDYLNTDRINKLIQLNRVFSWESFSPTSTRVNTKGLADLINTLRSGADPLSISIINDSLTQLSRCSISITKALKNLTDFHRERYKIAIRKLVLPGVIIDVQTLSGGTSQAIAEIKRSFAVTMKGQPFYIELVEEVLKEEYSPDHAVLQQELLSRLSVSKIDNSKPAAEESFKPVLLDGIRTLGAASPQLEELYNKFTENQRLVLSSEKSFFEKLARYVRKAFNLPEEAQVITITTVDPATQTGKRETVDFTVFAEDLRRRARILTGFTVRTSPAYQKIEMMEEQQIMELLTRQIAEMGNVLKTASGLDDYYKQWGSGSVHDHIRGVKVEISAIRNNLVKANQCRAEYTSQVEEQQQLKKLGITHA